MTVFILGKDVNGNVTYDYPFSDCSYEVQLASDIQQTLTVPEGMNFAVFSYSSGANVHINTAGVAIEAPATFTRTNQAFNKPAADVIPGQELSFFSKVTCIINVSFYLKRPN